ncbi:MAG TPA: PP2C family protein-serine/threonine phosphatase [Anaerolineae bacterium]|nr:PP2C family protein-serine/threonine phosphatase [Anaerolineae bacterium]
MEPQSQPLSIYIALVKVAGKFRKDIPMLPFERQAIAVGDVILLISAIPLLLIGLVWLALSSNWQIFVLNPLPLLVLMILILVFDRFSFFMITEIRQNRYGSSTGSLVEVVVWIGIFTFGISVIWLLVFLKIIKYFLEQENFTSPAAIWQQARTLVYELVEHLLILQIAFSVYLQIGGAIPISGLSLQIIIFSSIALLTHFLLTLVLWLPFLGYNVWVQQTLTKSSNAQPIIQFFLVAMGLPYLANPFSILASFLYQEYGFFIFLYFMIGIIIIAYLSRALSWAAESSRQQSRMLERLEQLDRAIILSSPENRDLPNIMGEHLPNMFPSGRLLVWTFPDNILYKYPEYWEPQLEEIWPWLLKENHHYSYLAKEILPWENKKTIHDPAIIVPIQKLENGHAFGGIYLELHTLAQPWDKRALQNICPAVQTLAAQITSAYNQKQIYEKTIDYYRISEEIRLAGEIQASLLPTTLPDLEGWQISVAFHPARETSGDFFDIIPLDAHRVGLVIADVLDKGIGPALYMTLSRTLIRTYATEFEAQPDLVFYAVNERILQDTSANLFVSTFYGILDTENGELTYANAGHNPPYLMSKHQLSDPIALEPTGIPIGIDEATWEYKQIQIKDEDTLVLYTDGIPEAQNKEGKLFQAESFIAVIKQNLSKSAEELQKAILNAVYEFVGDAPQSDDITMIVLKRN